MAADLCYQFFGREFTSEVSCFLKGWVQKYLSSQPTLPFFDCYFGSGRRFLTPPKFYSWNLLRSQRPKAPGQERKKKWQFGAQKLDLTCLHPIKLVRKERGKHDGMLTWTFEHVFFSKEALGPLWVFFCRTNLFFFCVFGRCRFQSMSWCMGTSEFGCPGDGRRRWELRPKCWGIMIRELSIAACWSLMDPLRWSSNPILLDAVEALLQELEPWSMLRWRAYYDQLPYFRSGLVHRSCGACRRSQVLFCRTKGQMPNRWKKRPRSLSW